MKSLDFNEQEVKIVLGLAKAARKELEEKHSYIGFCALCKRPAAEHHWPAGTCGGQMWSPNPKHFTPSTELVTEYDSIIKKLKMVSQ